MNNPLCFAYPIFSVSLRLRKIGKKDVTTEFNDPVEIFLHPELSEFKSALTGCLRHLVNASRDFNRPETLIGAGFGGPNSSSVNISKQKKLNDASVTTTDAVFVLCNQSIHDNLTKYFEEPSSLLGNFSVVESLLNGQTAKKVSRLIQECAGSQNTSETLEILTGVCQELGTKDSLHFMQKMNYFRFEYFLFSHPINLLCRCRQYDRSCEDDSAGR